MIRQALNAAKAFGLHRVELTVRENNVVAIQLYKKFGFAVEGLQRKRILVEGVYENLVLMGLLLFTFLPARAGHSATPKVFLRVHRD